MTWDEPRVVVAAFDFLLSTCQLLWTVVVAFVAAWVSVHFFKALTPILRLEVGARRIQDRKDLVIVGLELENISKVRIPKKKVLLSVQELVSADTDSASTGDCVAREWVEFGDAEEVFTSTVTVDPGEKIHVERAYKLRPGQALQVGLQFQAAQPFISHLVPWPKQWTTTRIVGFAPES